MPHIKDLSRGQIQSLSRMYFLLNKHSERVGYCFCHENIKFISLSQRVMLFLLYTFFRQKANEVNRQHKLLIYLR